MSAISLAKHALSALNSEKPHSSITDWVEILTAHTVDDEAYDGIPELVDSINLQPTGPAEASRAIRKKLKHGDAHRQYRALVILKALVENGGAKFSTTFADSQLTDAIKQLAADPTLDQKVRRKLIAVLASWHRQYKNDPKMSVVANLYKNVRDSSGVTLYDGSDTVKAHQANLREKELQKERERMEAKEKIRQEKEDARKHKLEQKTKTQKATRPTRRPFDFEAEKPKILTAIVEASQASNNLVNALQLVNREHESVQENQRVQECLAQLKQIRKYVVRYVQLVENEQLIGTLIDTNERVISALETYDNIYAAEQLAKQETEDNPQSLRMQNTGDSELGKLQSKQRSRVARSMNRSRDALPGVHPDLEDLSFGHLGRSNQELPPPLRPSAPDSPGEDSYRRGSLSDYSDFDSSDEADHQPSASGSNVYSYRNDRSESEELDVRKDAGTALVHNDDDPFADPFADQAEVNTPDVHERKAMHWG